jgi:pimeloyl-ACP methyl ester carboxylesterase
MGQRGSEARVVARSRRGLLVGLCAFLLGMAVLGAVAAYHAGSVASAPARESVGPPPSDLPIEPVTFAGSLGSRLSGWFIPGRPHAGAVLLLHGVHANRLQMLKRACLLHGEGFAVLLFDFQAHGESDGDRITFGYLEAQDARAAFDLLRRKAPGERVGVIGLSLGGAAAVLAELPADAMVLEAVYASFHKAVENRLVMRLGPMGAYLAPLLTWQVKARLGFDPEFLRPADRIAKLHAPVLIIAGDADQHATLDEARLLYARASEPKQLWVIPGARHVDFHDYATEAYERRVLGFLRARLQGQPE